jgi:hypothetical protein
MTNQFHLPQVDSNQVVETSHLKDQWKQDAPELNFQSHSKGSEYLRKIRYFYLKKYIYKCANISKNLLFFVIMGYCVQIDEEKH